MQVFKVKVVTFYSGEQSINVLKQKLDEQEKVNIDHVILEYLPLAISINSSSPYQSEAFNKSIIFLIIC